MIETEESRCQSGRKIRSQWKKQEDFHEMPLADLPVGASGTILKIMPELRGKKKFADVGLIAGTNLRMEAHAPFGGLLRIRALDTSMAIHRDDALHVMIRKEAEQ